MKVNIPFDVTSAQTTSKPSKSKGSSTSTDTLFGSILGQKSHGSEKTSNGTPAAPPATRTQASANEGAAKRPASDKKMDDQPTRTDPKGTDGAKKPDGSPEADDTAVADEAAKPEEGPQEGDKTQGGDNASEGKETQEPEEPAEDTAPEAGKQIFIQPGPIFLVPGAQMDATAPPVIQQTPAVEQVAPQQVVMSGTQDIVPDLAAGAQDPAMTAPQEALQGAEALMPEDPAQSTRQQAASEANVVLEIDPELAQKAQLPDEAGRVKGQPEKAQGHADAKGGAMDQAEAFAAQVVTEAQEMANEQGGATAEDGLEADPDLATTEDEEPRDADATDISKKDAGSTQKTQHNAVNTAQVADNGRVDFRMSGAQPLEAQQNVPQEVREFNMARVVDQVRTEITPDKTEFYIQLKPDHLGGLSIALVSEDKGVVAKLMTSSQQVHNALQADMNQMVQMLRDKGINVVQMEVIYDQTANSMMNHDANQQQRQQTGGHGGRSHGRVGEIAEEAMSMYDTLSSYEVLTEQGGSVEYTA